MQISTVQEAHAEGKRLIRVRYRLRPSGYLQALLTISVLPLLIAVGLGAWSGTAEAMVPLGICGSIWALSLGLWWRGTRRAGQALAVLGAMARNLGLVRCEALAESGGER